MSQAKTFKGVREEVMSLIKKSKGRSIATANTKRWFKQMRTSTGDSSIVIYNGTFKPGKIYAFRYENPVNKDRIWDRNPVVLSLGRKDGFDIGINLNYLSYPKRLDLLDTVFRQFEKEIQRSIKTSGSDALSQMHIKSMTFSNMERILKDSGYMNAFRRYSTSKRKKTTLIGYTNWNRAVLLDIADITNGNIRDAHNKTNK